MATNQFDHLLELIFSFYGLLGIVSGLLVVIVAKRSRPVAWLLFSLYCFAASLSKYADQWILEPPSLVFPLQQLREIGRPLTIILLGLLLILGQQTPSSWRQVLIPRPVYYLMVVQGVIFYKTLYYGDVVFALQAALTFGAVVLMVRNGPSRWLQDEDNFHMGVLSLAMVGIIFTVACTYQGIFNMQAMIVVQGRFNGTAGNAIHASVLLSAIVPCLIFLIEHCKKWNCVKIAYISILFIMTYFLFLTGSRTGFIMAITSVFLFYRNRGSMLLRFVIIAGLAFAVIITNISPEAVSSLSPLSDRYMSGENTRQGVWSGMWNSFVENPFFGYPLSEKGGRLAFGESSWLGIASATGLPGLIPLVMMGWECLKMMLQLHKLSDRKPKYFLHASTIIAGLSSLLIGSFGEAIFLGTLTFPVITLLLYVSLGKFLLDLDKTQRDEMISVDCQI